MTSGITFSIKFPGRLNLVICNTYNAKTSFLPFQAYHFSTKNRSKNHVFLKPLLGPHFSHVLLIFSKMVNFGTPFEIRWAPKWHQNRPSGTKIASKPQRCTRLFSVLVFLFMVVGLWGQKWHRNKLSDPQNRKIELARLPLEPLKSHFASDFRNRSKQSRTSENLQNSRQRNCIVAICRLQNASNCNKRTHQSADLQSEGAAVLAPHGALRSAAPCSQGTGGPRLIANSYDSYRFCRLQSLSRDPASAADPCRRIASFTPPPRFSIFFSFLGPLKDSSKIGPLSNPPKTSKIGPLDAQS